MSPYGTTAEVTIRKFESVSWLMDMRIPVTELVVCPEVQKELYDSYTRLSGHKQLPQVFVEDAHDGGHREYVAYEQLEVRCRGDGHIALCMCCSVTDFVILVLQELYGWTTTDLKDVLRVQDRQEWANMQERARQLFRGA